MSKFMRLMVFFDLPVVEHENKREYQKFRRFLLNDGYIMLQYSVYSRVVNGNEGATKHISRLNKNLPPKGSVRFLQITEKQYNNMKFLVGEPTVQEKTIITEQLSIF